jgi:hypothetical protein
MSAEIRFEVTGRTLSELEDAAAKELLKFVDTGAEIDYEMNVSSLVGSNTAPPCIVLWRGYVTARV